MTDKFVLVVEDCPRDEALPLRALDKSGIFDDVVIVRGVAEALDFLLGQGAHDGATSRTCRRSCSWAGCALAGDERTPPRFPGS